MLNKIVIHGPASYRNPVVLETDKNVNLIYGLNGTGKSTFSEFLRNHEAIEYRDCSITPTLNDDEEILVYNEKYVHEVFYSSPTIHGIFSLSKENASAKRKIDEANSAKKDLDKKYSNLIERIKTERDNYNNNRQSFLNRIWEIKTNYYVKGDVLEYCLTGFIGSKQFLYDHLIGITKPSSELTYDIQSLKEELVSLNKANGTVIDSLQEYNLPSISNDVIKLVQDVITGNKDSRVSILISKIQSADWVKQGLSFDSNDVCPFCQRPYEDSSILENLKSFFNEDYERSISQLHDLMEMYETQYEQLNSYLTLFNTIDCIKNLTDIYAEAFNKFKNHLRANIDILSEKIKNPSRSMRLHDICPVLDRLNDVIKEANKQIQLFNLKIQNIDQQKLEIKDKFWQLMRMQYDQTIEAERKITQAEDRLQLKFEEDKTAYESKINRQKQIIETEQANVINIDEAIVHINDMLLNMGITDFSITKHSEDGMYCLVRGKDPIIDFQSLSEGERTIISFLYFVETCLGLKDKASVNKKRIIVIDDPVSSLSSIYIFNVGRIIKEVFMPKICRDSSLKSGYSVQTKFEQIFILTHSLYFFYEITEITKEHRDVAQALFRLSKSDSGSSISAMHYESIQTDYQSYWMAVRDPNTHPALLANCMRNIVEYFFNFVEKKDFNNVFNAPKFSGNTKFQAFYRYMNRESHSLGQNVYDFKDFDYENFKDGLRLLFEENGYIDHYNKMMNLNVKK